MGRPINRLTARAVATLPAGLHADGGGLYLNVTDGGTRSWVMRYQLRGARHEIGLGPTSLVSLQEARQRALEHRRALARGEDPLEARRAARALQRPTWGQCVDRFIAAKRSGWKNAEQAHQWEHSLRAYGPDRALPVDRVDTGVVLACLAPIWAAKTETASRVRGRIERVLDFARVSEYREGENPARWRGHLDHMLAAPTRVARRRHFAAMPYPDVPAFVAALRARRAHSALALRFTILTAARTDEVIGAPWSEFDLDRALWTIPPERMKAGREHAVPLSDQALALLADLPLDAPPFALSENAMLYLVQKRMRRPVTVHGFRSSFRDWAAETTRFPAEVVEMALAHAIKDKTEAAYRRGTLLEKRRELMQAWADFVSANLG